MPIYTEFVGNGYMITIHLLTNPLILVIKTVFI